MNNFFEFQIGDNLCHRPHPTIISNIYVIVQSIFCHNRLAYCNLNMKCLSSACNTQKLHTHIFITVFNLNRNTRQQQHFFFRLCQKENVLSTSSSRQIKIQIHSATLTGGNSLERFILISEHELASLFSNISDYGCSLIYISKLLQKKIFEYTIFPYANLGFFNRDTRDEEKVDVKNWTEAVTNTINLSVEV